MTIYVILFFVALLIGMAVSVYAFGTASNIQRQLIISHLRFTESAT